MRTWVVTGVSGSGRIELLRELAVAARSLGKQVAVYDVGTLIQEECRRNGLPFSDQRILDLDRPLLRSLRSGALKSVQLSIQGDPTSDLHLVGAHATFRWKHRIIPGISYFDLLALAPEALVNVVDDVESVYKTNQGNPKWAPGTSPSYVETQDWMIEEELVTEVLADVIDKPVFIVARRHRTDNLLRLLFGSRKRIYLSYPITAIRKVNPELLAEIQGPVLTELEKSFVVFDPLAVKDMALATSKQPPEALDKKAVAMLKARTVERDFQFIDQSDGIVVVYLTDKLSPGVIAEMEYAHRNQKPVFLAFGGDRSPFLEKVATTIAPDIRSLLPYLQAWAAAKGGLSSWGDR